MDQVDLNKVAMDAINVHRREVAAAEGYILQALNF